MSYGIKLHHLRAFHAVLLTGSVTSAAERLRLTQPAISRQLALLEEAVGLCLFERTSGGRMRLSSDGVKFFREIEGTLEGIERIPEIAKSVAKHGKAQLRVGGTHPVVNSDVFARALQQYRQLEPEVRVIIEARQRVDFEEWVASGQMDVGLALLPIENPYIDAVPLVDMRVVAVICGDNLLATRDVLTPADVRHQPLILPKQQLLRTRIDNAIANSGEIVVPDIEASSTITCCKLAAQGLGIALCDPFSPTAFPSSNLKVVRWEPNVPLSYGIVWRKGSELSKAANKFASCLRESIKGMTFLK